MTNVPLHLESRLVVTDQSIKKEEKSMIVSPLLDPLFVQGVDEDSRGAISALSSPSHWANKSATCDACKICQDVCESPECDACRTKACSVTQQRGVLCSNENKEERYYTPCQIRRHNHAGSAWLVAGDTVYDATPYLTTSTHPGGTESILKRAGGAKDCSRDFQFHSALGKRMFKKYEIGKVRPCQSCNVHIERKDPAKQWWSLLF